MVLLVGLQCVIAVLPDHIHLLLLKQIHTNCPQMILYQDCSNYSDPLDSHCHKGIGLCD